MASYVNLSTVIKCRNFETLPMTGTHILSIAAGNRGSGQSRDLPHYKPIWWNCFFLLFCNTYKTHRTLLSSTTVMFSCLFLDFFFYFVRRYRWRHRALLGDQRFSLITVNQIAIEKGKVRHNDRNELSDRMICNLTSLSLVMTWFDGWPDLDLGVNLDLDICRTKSI